MLPYSREVYYSLFAELNTRFGPIPWIASLLALYLAFRLLRPNAGHTREIYALLAVLWAGCAYFWFYAVFAEINFLAPAYAALAALQALGLAAGAALPASRSACETNHAAAIPLIALGLTWPLIDLLTGNGWPMVRLAGLHLLPLLWLTQASLLRMPVRFAAALGWIPLVFCGVCAFEAYVLGLHQDWLPLIGCAYVAAIQIRGKTKT